MERRKAVPITYKSVEVDAGFRVDLLADKRVFVELKAVESIAPIHKVGSFSFQRHSRESENPETHSIKTEVRGGKPWIPAFAGMTGICGPNKDN